jgi:hypothetical protein
LDAVIDNDIQDLIEELNNYNEAEAVKKGDQLLSHIAGKVTCVKF